MLFSQGYLFSIKCWYQWGPCERLTLGSSKFCPLPLVRVVDSSENLKIIFKNIGGDPFKHFKVKLIVCMSRLIDKESHFKFFSASESLVFKTIFAALLCARSNLSRSSYYPNAAPSNIAIIHNRQNKRLINFIGKIDS